jgi:hypothetical protein
LFSLALIRTTTHAREDPDYLLIRDAYLVLVRDVHLTFVSSNSMLVGIKVHSVQLRTIKLDNFDANKTRFFWLPQIVRGCSKTSI